MNISGKTVSCILVVAGLLCGQASPAHATGQASRTDDGQSGLKSDRETRELLVFLSDRRALAALLREHKLEFLRQLRSTDRAVVLAASSPQAAIKVRDRLRENPNVRAAFLNERSKNELAYSLTGEYSRSQWHLQNNPLGWPHINVEAAWAAGWTGKGVGIGIVDTGIEHTHEDLAANYMPGWSYDFAYDDGDPDPTPPGQVLTNAGDAHGTLVAGIAAAVGTNETGISGVAPEARLAGLKIPRLVFDNLSAADDIASTVDAILYMDNATAPGTILDPTVSRLSIKNHSYGNFLDFNFSDGSAAELFALGESTDAGMIHVLGAGNSRNSEQKDIGGRDLGRSTDVIFVAAIACHWRYAEYSSYGSNVFVSAPSSQGGADPSASCDGSGDPVGLMATDTSNGGKNHETTFGSIEPHFPDHRYTDRFGGTSAAAPVIAGVIALGKQAQPALDARFAKHLLARTSTVIDSGDSTPESFLGWTTNAAGFEFNPNYGFGLVDAYAFVQLARNFSGVSQQTTYKSAIIPVGQSIPTCVNPDGPCRLERVITVAPIASQAQPLEEVSVILDIDHEYRGLLSAEIESPSGTRSRLFNRDLGDTSDDGIENWPFVTNAFWGESPSGDWIVRVYHTSPHAIDKHGSWNSVVLLLNMGDLAL